MVESSSHVSVLFREVFNHPYISFFSLLVNVFSVTGFRTFLDDPLPSFILVGGIRGWEEIYFCCKYRVVEGSTLVSVHFTEAFSHPNISFFLVSVVFNGPILFDDPLLSLYWWAVSVDREELKWHQLEHHQ